MLSEHLHCYLREVSIAVEEPLRHHLENFLKPKLDRFSISGNCSEIAYHCFLVSKGHQLLLDGHANLHSAEVSTAVEEPSRCHLEISLKGKSDSFLLSYRLPTIV